MSSKNDVSGRTVLDAFNEELVPGDIIAIADNSTIIIGVYLNHFDNGSGWKIRYRVPNTAYRRNSQGYNPTNMIDFSWGGNSTVVARNSWNKTKIADDAIESCNSVFRVTTPLSCQAYQHASKLRDIMIKNKDIVIESESTTVTSEEESDVSVIDVDFNDILSTLGAPEIEG